MIQYRILETGFFHADGGAMFGAIPKRAWSRKCSSDAENRCLLAMNCVVAWNRDRVVLLDTGAGSKPMGKYSYYDFKENKDVRDALALHGFKPGDVTDVVLSHLHFDHAGGCTFLDDEQRLQVAFPNARHYVSRRQWSNYLDPNDLECDSFRKEDLLPVEEAGLLTLVDSKTEILPGFHVDLFDGHSFGQLASWFESGDELVVFPGDVIPTRAHLSDGWISAYDIEPLESLASKKRLKELTEKENRRFVFYH